MLNEFKSIVKKIPGIIKTYIFLNKVINEFFWLVGPSERVLNIENSKMYINVRDKDPTMRCTFRTYALNRCYEKYTTRLFKKVIKEGDVVVDLGANIGYFTLLAAKLVGKNGKVYSFEPEPKNYNYLQRNIKLNGYDNAIAIQKAISDKISKVKLYICPYDSGHHTIGQYEGIRAYKPNFVYEKEEFIEVETIPLDNFFNEKGESINVIKMDVEGAEMLALSGMDKILKENEKIKMFIEFFPFLIKKMGNSPEEFIRKLLEDYNFSIFIVGRDYSMRNNNLNEEYLKINSVHELMDICKDELTHVNLFLKRR